MLIEANALTTTLRRHPLTEERSKTLNVISTVNSHLH